MLASQGLVLSSCMPAEQLPTETSAQFHEEGLRHQLSAAQMAMVSVGGSIGTGLLLGSGVAMEIAGPGAILSFIAAAFIHWTVAMALGELACAHPAGAGQNKKPLYSSHITSVTSAGLQAHNTAMTR